MAGRASPRPEPIWRAACRSTHRAWREPRCADRLSMRTRGYRTWMSCSARHHPRRRVIQYSRDVSAKIEKLRRTRYPLELVIGLAKRRDPWRGMTTDKNKCEAADAVEALDPGVPYESRWAPYDQVHGPGQGQFPKGSIRPRGYMAPDAQRSFARANVATMKPNRQH